MDCQKDEYQAQSKDSLNQNNNLDNENPNTQINNQATHYEKNSQSSEIDESQYLSLHNNIITNGLVKFEDGIRDNCEQFQMINITYESTKQNVKEETKQETKQEGNLEAKQGVKHKEKTQPGWLCCSEKSTQKEMRNTKKKEENYKNYNKNGVKQMKNETSMNNKEIDDESKNKSQFKQTLSYDNDDMFQNTNKLSQSTYNSTPQLIPQIEIDTGCKCIKYHDNLQELYSFKLYTLAYQLLLGAQNRDQQFKYKGPGINKITVRRAIIYDFNFLSLPFKFHNFNYLLCAQIEGDERKIMTILDIYKNEFDDNDHESAKAEAVEGKRVRFFIAKVNKQKKNK